MLQVCLREVTCTIRHLHLLSHRELSRARTCPAKEFLMISFPTGQSFCSFGIRVFIVCGFVLTNFGRDFLTWSRAWVTTPLQQEASCQLLSHVLKNKPSLCPDLLFPPFALQVVGVDLLKSLLNACRKLDFNQGKSQASPSRARNQEAENLVASVYLHHSGCPYNCPERTDNSIWNSRRLLSEMLPFSTSNVHIWLTDNVRVACNNKSCMKL